MGPVCVGESEGTGAAGWQGCEPPRERHWAHSGHVRCSSVAAKLRRVSRWMQAVLKHHSGWKGRGSEKLAPRKVRCYILPALV